MFSLHHSPIAGSVDSLVVYTFSGNFFRPRHGVINISHLLDKKTTLKATLGRTFSSINFFKPRGIIIKLKVKNQCRCLYRFDLLFNLFHNNGFYLLHLFSPRSLTRLLLPMPSLRQDAT